MTVLPALSSPGRGGGGLITASGRAALQRDKPPLVTAGSFQPC